MAFLICIWGKIKIKYRHMLIDLYMNSKIFTERQNPLNKAEGEIGNFIVNCKFGKIIWQFIL